MNQPDYLFQLIKQLSQAEKRYFVTHNATTGKGEDKDYIILYKCIDGLNEYSEDLLRSKLPARLSKNLGMLKKYLYDTLLSTLVSFEAADNAEIQASSFMQQYEVLLQRNLPQQASVRLQAVKKLVEKHELYLFMPEILTREVVLATAMGESVDLNAQISEMEKLNRYQAFELLFNQWEHKTQSNTFTDAFAIGTRQQLMAIIHELPYKNLERKALALLARCSCKLEKYTEAVKHYKQAYKLLEESTLPKEDEVYGAQAVTILDELIHACLNAGLMNEALDQLAKLKALPQKNKRIISKVQFTLLQTEPYIARKAGKQRLFMSDRYEELKGILNTQLNYMTPREQCKVLFRMAITAFEGRYTGECVRLLNQLAGIEWLSKETEIYNAYRVLDMMAQADMNNIPALELRLQSAKRHFSGKNQTFGLGLKIAMLIKTIVTSKNLNQDLLSTQLEEVKSDLWMLSPQYKTDIVNWFESIIYLRKQGN